MPNLLAIDIGNTNISIGFFKDNILKHHMRISTNINEDSQGYKIFLKEIVKEAPDGIILSSVVPSVTEKIKKTLKGLLNMSVLVVGEDIDSKIKNLYDANANLGRDRIINATAAIYLYGYPVIIINFGTAITIDIISEKGEFMGGTIMAGIKISLNALSSRTALLPKIIDITPPKNLVGTNTIDCMKSGIFYGVSSMVDGLVDKLRARFDSKVISIATGGDAEVIYPYCKTIDKVDTKLTLEGLRIIFNNEEIYKENNINCR